MAKKVILKDDNVEIMPITRGELILDSSGQLAFHSSQFLATQSLPGLMSGEDKTKLDSLEKVIVEDKKVEQVNTTANDNYRLLFSSSADDTTKTEGAQKSAKLLFNPSTGALTATALIGKLDWSNLNGIPEKFTPEQHIHNTSEITALTSYSKASSASDLVTTDTLNAALGKLEYKADTAYDWIISVTTADTDKYINKWQEILDFLNAVDNSEGADIIDEFVTRKTGQTITGVKTFSTLLKFIVALGTSPFTVTSTTKVDNLNADLLDGKHDGEVTAQYFSPGKLLTSSDTINKLMSGIYCYINGDNPTGSVDDNVVLLSFRNTGRTDMIQFVGAANTTNLYYRRAANIGNQYENWTSWKTIAFTDSNVASATQVMINYSYNQDINYPLVFTSRDNIGVAKNGDLYIDFSGRPTYNPKSNTLTVGNINMTGSINNVLKATTSLGAALLNIAEVTADTNYVHLYVSSLNSSATNNRALVLQNGYGNVGIGDSNPAYKLEVAGSICGTVIYANRDASTTAGGVSLYSNSDPMTYGIAFRGTGTYGTHGYVTAADDWATYLTMSDTANRGWIFRRGSTNVASIAGSGNMAIGQNLKFSNEAHISTNRSTDYHYGYTFNLTANEQSIGMYSGPIGEAGGVVISPDGCLIYNSSDCGYNLQVRDKDLGADLTNAATLTFGIEQSGYYAWSRGGFKKNGSDDSYVLLGGGGHKSISSFQTTYDGRYVLKAGDTMTGPLTISTATWGNLLVLNRVNNGENWGPSIIFKFDGTHNGSLTMLSNLLYVGDNGGVRYKAWHEGNDGSGSGLDADLLDGTHKTGLLTALSSSSSTNLSITVGGTTKSITNTYATNITLISCYNGTTNNDLWSTIKTGNSTYLGTANIYEVYNDGGPTTYGEVLDIVSTHTNHWLSLLWFGSGKAGHLYYRNKDYNDATWGSWRIILDTGNYTETLDGRYVNVTGDTMTGNLTVPSLNSYYLFKTTDIAEGAANLGTLATAHTITFFRNGIMIPYKMDNANDGGMIRTKGASEDACVFEMATWDDSGAGETIQLNYYSTTSQLTPTYSNTVPKVSGTLLNSGNWPSYIGGHGYVMREYTIDATGLDLNTWYPVTMTIGACPNVRIEVRVSLNSGSKPSWSTHGSGFSVRKIWEVNGSGWGTNAVHRTVFVSDYAHASTDPVRGIGDMGLSSTEYVYVRGGGRYYFYTSHNITPYLRTSTYVGTADPYYQAISPTTTAPGTIAGFLINRSMYASHFYENSDIKLKENINLISSSDNIPLLKEFNWKSDGKHSYGLIAQELEAMGYSELVEDSGDHKTVNYSAALSLIVGKLQVKIKELEKEIEILKNKN